MSDRVSISIDGLAAGMLLLLAAVWGGSFFFAEIALREVGPLTVVLHRVFWAMPVLFLVLRRLKLRLPTDPRSWAAFLIMGALNNVIPFSLIFWGQVTIESGLASVLNATTGVIGAVVAGLLLADERLSANKIAGAALGTIGVAVVMGLENLTSLDPRNLAQWAILGAALSYSLAGVWGKIALRGHPPLVNATGMLVGSVILMTPVAIVVEGPPDLALSLHVWLSLLGLALFSTVAAYALYFAILARAGAANLMLVTLLIPGFAILLGTLFLGETLVPRVYFGLGVTGIGLLITDGRLLAKLQA